MNLEEDGFTAKGWAYGEPATEWANVYGSQQERKVTPHERDR